jgi:ACT domain-containing protein
MTQVSKRSIKPATWNIIWKQFVNLSKNDDTESPDILLKGLLTETEQIMLAKRLTVHLLILSGWEMTDIADAVKISKSTVYKYRDALQLQNKFSKTLQKKFPHKIKFKQEYKQKGWLEKLIVDVFKSRQDRTTFQKDN